MAEIGLVNNIYEAAVSIDAGRIEPWFAALPSEEGTEGRISYEDGIVLAMTSFQEAQAFTDPQIILLAEYTFITQEFQLCDEADKYTRSSLTKAIQSFDDAFLALEAVGEASYTAVEKAIPHSGKYRVSGFPKDAYHIACIAHKTRLQNILSTPGLDPIEKKLLEQRLTNLSTAQSGYVERQKKALGGF